MHTIASYVAAQTNKNQKRRFFFPFMYWTNSKIWFYFKTTNQNVE